MKSICKGYEIEKMRETKDCPYPDCLNCTYDDCIMDGGIQALLKRRRYKANPEYYRQKQRDYRAKVREHQPRCDECKHCVLVKNDKGTDFKRLCIVEMHLVMQKVTLSPQWCPRRLSRKEYDHLRYLRRKEAGLIGNGNKTV